MKNPQLITLGIGAAVIAVAFIIFLPDSSNHEVSEVNNPPSTDRPELNTHDDKAQNIVANSAADLAESVDPESTDGPETPEAELAANQDQVLPPVITEMLEQPDYYGATDILDVIGYEPGPERVKKLIAAYEASASSPIGIRESLMNELAYEEVGNENIHNLLIKELQSDDPETRQRAADNIKYADDDSILGQLKTVAKENDNPQVAILTADLIDWYENTISYQDYVSTLTPSERKAFDEKVLNQVSQPNPQNNPRNNNSRNNNPSNNQPPPATEDNAQQPE